MPVHCKQFMKAIIQILVIIFSFIQIGFSQSQTYLLKKSYKKNSIEMLTQFFENWANEIPSNEASVVNDTIQEAYRVFKGFYRPTQISLLGGSEWEDSIYLNAKYFVVQTEIGKIQFADKVYFTQAEKDSIIISRISNIHKNDTTMRELWIQNYRKGKLDIADELFESDSIVISSNNIIDICSSPVFRPPISYNDKKAVYLTSEYSKIINKFLGNTHYREFSMKKKEFLDNIIITFYGNWRGWQIYTYPYVYSITFDRNMQYARVDYIIVYGGGNAILEKQGDKWIIVYGERTWIE